MMHTARLTMALTIAILLPSCKQQNVPSPAPVLLRLELPAPALTEANQALAVDFYRALASAHSSCGLNAAKFQDSIQKLQEISTGSDFQQLSDTYVTAARLCHDAKVKPSRYVSSSAASEARNKSVDVVPSLEVTHIANSVSVGVKVPVGYKQGNTTTQDTLEIIEYAPQLSVTPEELRILQGLEDSAYVAILETLRKEGFRRFKAADLAGKWSWKWQDNGQLQGRIEFTLSVGGMMEAYLYPSSNNILYKLSNWGDGDWELNGNRLVVTMRRVGNQLVPLATKDHTETWINNDINQLNEEEILLENGQKLIRIPVPHR